MSQINSTTSLTGSTSQTSTDAFADLGTDAFLDLMIAELQNQDPLDPADNEELLNQIYQIRQIESNDALTGTLDSILLGQNVSSATSLIGADVVALTDEGERVSGNVRKVTINDGEPTLDIAVDIAAENGSLEGGLASGQYVYEVVWEDDDGTPFSVEVAADTSSFAEFTGSVQVSNLPQTDGPKKVYRTDVSGGGDRQLVAELPGISGGFTDTTSDANRGETLSGSRQRLEFARKASVTLNNVSEITPPD